MSPRPQCDPCCPSTPPPPITKPNPTGTGNTKYPTHANRSASSCYTPGITIEPLLKAAPPSAEDDIVPDMPCSMIGCGVAAFGRGTKDLACRGPPDNDY